MKTFNRFARAAAFTALALISQAAWAAGSVDASGSVGLGSGVPVGASVGVGVSSAMGGVGKKGMPPLVRCPAPPLFLPFGATAPTP